jgi:predicted transcriptional regulator
MITIEQIKAGRSLLSWSQAELAKVARISLPALGNLERGIVTPRVRTLESVQKALESAGIEFIDTQGVTRHREVMKIEMFEGRDAVKKLFDDIYTTMDALGGGDQLVSGISEKEFMPLEGAALLSFMRKQHKHKNMRGRALVCEGDTHFVGKPHKNIYRWVDKESFGLIPYYIYGDKYAVIHWGPPRRVVVIQNPSLAETHRRQFEKEWKQAKIPPAGIKHYWPHE